MYRFRTTYGLLDGFKELENQEIYFADFPSLNDPMEGFRNIIWKGDKVLWKNLIKHYLFNFYITNNLIKLKEDEYIFSQKDINVFVDETDLPESIREKIQDLYDFIFDIDGMEELIELLGDNEEVNEEALMYILIHIHSFTLQYVFGLLHNTESEKTTTSQLYLLSIRELVSIWNKFKSVKFTENGSQKFNEAISLFVLIMNANNLATQHNKRESINNRSSFIFFDFPSAYINAIKTLIYPEAYVACFMEDCTNPAMWGYYGDSHKGVCLKFRTHKEDEKDTLPLEVVHSMGGDGEIGKKTKNIPFTKIKYTSNYHGNINFFSNIGVVSKQQIIDQWYTGENNELSSLAAPFLQEDEGYKLWHMEYWEKFNEGYTFKLTDWEYEREHRLILSSPLNIYNEPKLRKIKYNFEDLEGIIFGIKTSLADKLKIISIIEGKCKEIGRHQFDFYQAKYSENTGKIEKVNLMIGKFEF